MATSREAGAGEVTQKASGSKRELIAYTVRQQSQVHSGLSWPVDLFGSL